MPVIWLSSVWNSCNLNVADKVLNQDGRTQGAAKKK